MLEIILVAAARPVRPGEAYRGASELDFFRRLNTNDGAISSRSLATARPPIADSLSGDVAGHEVC